jgi:hypothetical protein
MSSTLINPFQQSLVLYAGGLTGFNGFQGPLGYQGDAGFQGGVGMVGVQGAFGIQGRVGLQGPDGTQGIAGINAIGVQGWQGVQGRFGLQGLDGPQGLEGVQGIIGFQGNDGTAGLVGVQGRQGIAGIQGNQGLTNTEFAITTAYQLLGSAIKSVNLNHLTGWLTSAITLVSQQQKFVPVYVQTAATLTGVMFEMNTQGVYTANNYNGVGLYSINAGTLTLVASSANNGNLYKAAAQSLVKEPFAVAYSAAVGVYYISLLYSNSAETTAPSISGQSANFNLGRADFSNSYVLSGTLAGRTTLIASQAASGLSESVNSVWVNVY